jgi:heterotetrameric sarcosine oxidase gamma subunit
MLERKSALASARAYSSNSLTIAERRGFTLIQVAGLDSRFEEELEGLYGNVPAEVGKAKDSEGRIIMRTGPAQFWIVDLETDDIASRLQGKCALTPLSHSRVRIALSGLPVRDVLAKLMPLDFHPSVFAPGSFALTGIHHTPVTVHCTGQDSFDIYVMRTFALNVWEMITDAALEFANVP